MESLVPDYGSDSDSDSGASSKHLEGIEDIDTEGKGKVVEQDNSNNQTEASLMFHTDPLNLLKENDSSNSSSDSDDRNSVSDEECLDQTTLTLQKRPSQSLENPFRSSIQTKSLKEDSVFQIEFREKDKIESAALERHVKMTPKTGTQTMINGKKICWNYRKGKCRFGHNCTFAHDSDIPVSSEEKGDVERKFSLKTSSPSKVLNKNPPDFPPSTTTISPSAYFTSEAKLGGYKEREKIQEDQHNAIPDLDDSIEMGNHHRGAKFGKKRPGLSQSLVPGKKVMKNYFDQKKS